MLAVGSDHVGCHQKMHNVTMTCSCNHVAAILVRHPYDQELEAGNGRQRLIAQSDREQPPLPGYFAQPMQNRDLSQQNKMFK